MRPHKLTISAFGPYADKVDINFDNFGTQGLFLVTGDTGAGKTTIFDAITYALFGKASGNSRNDSMFRSTYAQPSTPTFVELNFEYAGVQYIVRRSPEQERPKDRGMGTTIQKKAASLQVADNAPITDIKSVNAKLEDILGVNFEQYSQIAMIAQGQFRELLLAETKEREKIFRSIFKTGVYLDLQKKLQEEANALYGQLQDKRKSALQYVDGAVCLDANVHAAELTLAKARVKQNEINIEDVYKLIGTIIAEEKEQEKALDEEVEKLQGIISAIDIELNMVKQYNENKEKYDKAIAKRTERENEEKPILEKALLEAQKHQSEIDTLGEEIPQMRSLLPKYQKLSECEKAIKKNEDASKEIERQIKDVNEKYTDLEQNIKKQEEELQSIQDPAVELAQKDAHKEKLVGEREALSDLYNDIKEYRDDEAELTSLQDKIKQKEARRKSARDEYDQNLHLFIAEQAGFLAEELEEGVPCPVCGSTHHPQVAQKAAEALSKDKLDRMKENLGKIESEAIKVLTEYTEKHSALKTTQNALSERITTLLPGSDFDGSAEVIVKRIESIKSDIVKIEAELKTLKALHEREQTLENELPKNRIKLQEISERKTMLTTEKVRLDTEYNSFEVNRSSIKKELSYATEKDAKKALTEKENKRKDLEKAITDAESALQKFNTELATLNGNIQQLAESIKTAPKINVEEASKKKDDIEAEIRTKDELTSRLKTNNVINDGIIRNVDKTVKELTALDSEYRMKKTLSDTANGQLSGKERINLETYVQTAYFDRILQRANTRLMVMSDGQYELRRRTTFSGLASTGLDLNVLDHYNGTERNVRSLSGGEQFKAALSLALGLSDEIQTSAGGIQLDTMFVDEGFGSLDENSLQQALKALNDLTEGNRLIGIISHVAELKKIDRQIIITKDSQDYSQISYKY